MFPEQTNKQQRLTWLSHSWEEVENELVGPVDGGSGFYVEEFALLWWNPLQAVSQAKSGVWAAASSLNDEQHLEGIERRKEAFI